MGEAAFHAWYRLLYNLFSFVTFLPVLYLLATQVPEDPVWRIPEPVSYAAILVQVAGLVGLLVALLQTDLLDFVGVRPALDYLRGNGRRDQYATLVTGGMYAVVRHPLYFFSLLILWFNPAVTVDVLIFNLMSTLYFWIGSRYEERRLIAQFGEAYRQYQRSVPALLPLRLRQRESLGS